MADAPWRPSPLVGASIALHGAAAAAALVMPEWWPGLLATLAADHAVMGAAGMLPRSTLLGPNLSRLPDGAGVALTFDYGPDPAVTPAVLAMLAEAGAAATFFCIAERAAAHPGLVRAILAGGHRIENHTVSHPSWFAALPPGGLWREVAGAQAMLGRLGAAPGWFRAPMGLRSPLLGPVLARAGLREVSWTRRGYDGVSRDPAAVLRRLLQGLAGGDILLLHDGNAARRADGVPVVLAVLPDLLDALARRGLSAAALPAARAATAAERETRSPTAHAST